MRATTIHGPGDIRIEDVPDPTLEQPTDAIVRVVRGCVCGSDLWPYRGEDQPAAGSTIGHECIGVVEEIGAEVSTIRPGDFVVVPFDHCDNSCAHCRAGVHSACTNLGMTVSGQAEFARVTQADGTLVVAEETTDEARLASLLTLSDVLPTGWHAAVSAGVRKGGSVAVVGDGAVGLCGILAASVMGAETIIAMSRRESRQTLATEFGATHIVATRDREGAAEVKEITGGLGADAVLECVGTAQAIGTAFAVARPGATVGFVGVPHGVELPVGRMFVKNIGLSGGMAPVRRYLPELLDLVQSGAIDPGKVFDLTLPLEEAPEAYRAMDERRAIKVMLRP